MNVQINNKEDIQAALDSICREMTSYSLAIDNSPSLDKILSDFEEIELLVSIEDNSGIQDLFVLMHENLNEIKTKSGLLNQAQKYLLECWINDFSSLLSEENHSDHINSLVNLAMHYAWPLSLAKEDAVILSEMLNIESAVQTSIEESNLLEMTIAVDKDALSQAMSTIENDNTDVQKEENKTAEKNSNLFSYLTNIQKELEDYSLSVYCSPDISIIADNLLSLSDCFIESGHSGVNDICMLLVENLNDIQEDKKHLNQSQQYMTRCFFNYLSDYISDTEDTTQIEKMVNLLSHYDWPNTLNRQDATILLEMSGINISENDKEFNAVQHPEKDNTLADELPSETVDVSSNLDSNDSLDNSFVEQTEPKESVLDPLESFQLLVGEYNNNTADIGESLQNISDFFMNREDFAILDVIGVLEQNVTDAQEQLQSLSEQQLATLSDWSVLMQEYQKNNKDSAVISNMLELLQAPIWSSPLNKEDADVMLDMFGLGIEEQTPSESKLEPEPLETNNDFDEVAQENDKNEESILGQISIAEAAVESLASAKRTPVSSDLVEMLVFEMQQMQDELDDTLSTLTTPEDFSNFTTPISQYADRILRFGNACQAADMPGLFQVSNLMKENIAKLLQGEQQFGLEQKRLLEQWPNKILAYLQSLGDEEQSQEITRILLSDTWIEPLLSDVSPALIDLLSAPYIAKQDEIKSSNRLKTATPEDVSIALPEDINNELLEGLLIEMPGQVEELTDSIESLSNGTGSIVEMEKAQRVVHTIKGAANTVGIKGVATLTHNFEDILVALCEYKQLPSPQLNNAMMDAADCLQEMYESLSENSPAPSNAHQVLQSILDWANLIEEKGAEVLNEEVLKETSEIPEVETKQEEQSVSTLRVPTQLIDEILRLLSESMIHTSQLQDRLNNTEEHTESLFEQNDLVKNLVGELEQQVEIRGSAFNKQKIVNQQNDIFDPLEFEQYNELNTVTNRLTESVSDAKVLSSDMQSNIVDLNELLIEQTRTHRQLQELVMRSRMVPVKTLTPRLQRCVRQASRLTGKQVGFELSGTNTLIDRDVADIVLDPLMHILRNSIDHSIEDEHIRLDKQKTAKGRVAVDFYMEGANIVVKCSDDGYGLNYKKILDTAVNKGILNAEQTITNKELTALLMQPGFTTKKDVSQVSGRGVGMDVVRAQISSLKGTINIESEEGYGCIVELKIPASLLSNHGVLIKQDDRLYALANRGVEKIVQLSLEDILVEEGEARCEIDGVEYSVSYMQDLLRLPKRTEGSMHNYRSGIIIKDEEIEELVLYDEFIENMDFIIKNMGVYLKDVRGVQGGTILGNGDIAPVIDLPDLIRAANDKSSGFYPAQQVAQKVELPVALVVDDSLSARRALINIANDAGYETMSAQDGLDAADIINKKQPDIVLLDMEMPRMNGIELASHIRSNESIKHLPIIMITSRTTDKHKEAALTAGVNVYLSKPFQEDELLDSMHALLN